MLIKSAKYAGYYAVRDESIVGPYDIFMNSLTYGPPSSPVEIPKKLIGLSVWQIDRDDALPYGMGVYRHASVVSSRRVFAPNLFSNPLPLP